MMQKADDPLDTRYGAFPAMWAEVDGAEEGSADDLRGLGMKVRTSTKLVPVHKAPGA
jgi:hypothetical protein